MTSTNKKIQYKKIQSHPIDFLLNRSNNQEYAES